MKKILKLLVLNIGIVICAVVTYSDGLLGLRPSDPSILKAGFSILIGIALAAGLVFGNLRLLREPKTVEREALETPAQIEALLKSFTQSAYIGDLARTAVDQLRRLETSTRRTTAAIRTKFQRGSVSEQHYQGVIDAAEATAIENFRNMALRMQMFDDAEYRRLKNYRDDTIPDEIQREQLALYDKNMQFIRSSIAVNENLILKKDTLTLEISDSSARNENDADELLAEIGRLTTELKYYK